MIPKVTLRAGVSAARLKPLGRGGLAVARACKPPVANFNLQACDPSETSETFVSLPGGEFRLAGALRGQLLCRYYAIW